MMTIYAPQYYVHIYTTSLLHATIPSVPIIRLLLPLKPHSSLSVSVSLCHLCRSPDSQMARFVFTTMLVIFMLSAPLLSPSEGRKLLATTKLEKNKATLTPSSLLSSLPKGTVPSSSPSKKGHALVVDEKLIARHLSSLDGRLLLPSVPSPGVGH